MNDRKEGYAWRLIVPIVAGLCGGCMVGPAALQMSRLGYNKVIQQTTDEQLLLNLVRLQYRDAPAFLEVGSVSAQFSFSQSANLGGTINEGPSPTNPNRLGLGADVVYQERPTITFTPLQGKEFVHALLSPLAPEVMVLLSRSGWSIDRTLRLTVQSMNGVDNAASASGPTPKKAPQYERFARVSKLFRTLQEVGLLELGYESKASPVSDPVPMDLITLSDLVQAAGEGFGVDRTDDGKQVALTRPKRVLVWRIPQRAADRQEVRQIVELLDLAPNQPSYEIHLGTAASPTSTGGRTQINIAMRSLMATLFYLSQSVDVPPRHRRKGLVTTTIDSDGRPFDWGLVTGDLLQVHSQAARPAGAAVAVRHRGVWFYLDDTDLTSKSTFALLGQLFALQAGGVESVPPVLTLSVGG